MYLVCDIGLILAGCSMKLPGLQNIKTDDEFSKIFGIIPSKTDLSNSHTNPNILPSERGSHSSKQHVQFGEEVKPSESHDNNMAVALKHLSSMSALQLLQVLGMQLPHNLPENSNNNHQQIPMENIPREQQHSSQPVKQTVISNGNKQKTGKNQLLEGSLTANMDSNHNSQQINNQQKNNDGQFNTQQQISPLYMMTAGQGGQRFSQVSSQLQTGSVDVENKEKLFDPDELMHRLMSSSSASLGIGEYDLKQNVSPQNWLPKQSDGQQTVSGGDLTLFNPLFVGKTANFNPNSFNNVKMNFKPDALLHFAFKDPQQSNRKPSYDPDKINDYSGKFKPGQMPLDTMKYSSQSAHLLFNADTLNKKLMDEQNSKLYVNDETLRHTFVPTLNTDTTQLPERKLAESNFVPGLLYPGYSSDTEHMENPVPVYSSGLEAVQAFKQHPSSKSRQSRFSFMDILSDQPVELGNTNLNSTNKTLTTVEPEISGESNQTDVSYPEGTTTPSIATTTVLPVQMLIDTNATETKNGGVPLGQSNNQQQNGFVPGSLTGDGKTFQMMVNNGMFNPNKVNEQAFMMSGNQNFGSLLNDNKNKTTTGVGKGFNMLFNFDPSTVNQAKMSFNSNQQMGMDGSSGSSGSNFNAFYDPNKVNQNSFMNPLDKEHNMNNMSTGMFDNSQFLGDFDPNNVNLKSIGNVGNNSQNNVDFSGFGGSFNPEEVNKAYFNPNEVNQERMNFNPSEMLQKNPGYDKDIAESYKFDPNKINDIHMNFIPPFLQGSKNISNSTAPRFIPGLLSGGGDNSGIFDPSKMKTGMLFNPMALLQQNEASKNLTSGQSEVTGTGVMFNPSSMIGDLKDLLSSKKFDPNEINKVDLHFNPNEMMNHMLENAGTNDKTDGDNHSPNIGHGDGEAVK